MAVKFKSEQPPTDLPGPGKYNPPHLACIKKKEPLFVFGKSNRPDYGKNANPGPGAYKIPAMVSNLPNYVHNTGP